MADISISFFSQMMARNVTVKIILPFDTAHLMDFQEPYKTIYFLPGYSANAVSILSGTILAEEVAYKGFAAVIPDGENSFYADQPDINTFYERFIAEELVDVTRKLLPLSHKREDTYIGGISMGGFGSLMVGSRHMNRFSKIVAMSPATDAFGLVKMGLFPLTMMNRFFGDEENYYENYHPANVLLRAKEQGRELPKLYLCCGEQDPLTYAQDCQFVKIMQEAGIEIEVHNGEGAHDTKYWNHHLPSAVDFALRTEGAAE